MKAVIAALSAILLGACVSTANYHPLVDAASIDDPRLYEQDLRDCQAYARRIDPAREALAGAVIGALLGAAIGVAVGDSGEFARAGARGGAVSGAVNAAGDAAQGQVDVIRRCMAGRGYVVLM